MRVDNKSTEYFVSFTFNCSQQKYFCIVNIDTITHRYYTFLDTFNVLVNAKTYTCILSVHYFEATTNDLSINNIFTKILRKYLCYHWRILSIDLSWTTFTNKSNSIWQSTQFFNIQLLNKTVGTISVHFNAKFDMKYLGLNTVYRP